MAVFLTVLKIIGLVILGIIALVLAIILLILTLVFTVPVKYDGHLAIGGEEDTETDFHLLVHWLLKAVKAQLATTDQGLSTRIWLFGKEIILGGGMTIDDVLDFLFPPVDDETIAKENGEDLQRTKEFRADFERAVAEEEDFIEEEQHPTDFVSRVVDFFIEKTAGLREKYRKLKRQKRFLSRERVKNALKLILNFVVEVIRIVFPKNIQGRLHIGMESPADTGSFLAAASVMIPVTKDHLEIEPDFMNEALDGTLDFSTSVRIGGLVIKVVKFIFNKDVRYFMRRFRKYL